MKKKSILLIGLSLVAASLSAVALVGCNNSGYKFEEYSYNYGGESEKDWRALEYPDTDITVDGLVSAAEYGEQYLSFSDVNGVNMKVYAHMGEEGVFFGFVSNDRYVNYNPRNTVFNNTSVEIQVAPNGTETLNANVVQLRLGANGTPDQWIGFPSEDGYSYSNKYIPSTGVVHINGELNGSAEGYSVELYLPYTSIGLTERPESVVCAPSFNTMPDPLSSSRATWTMMLGCNLDQPATWYVVDGTGMTAHTAGFGEKNGTVSQSKGYNEFYYFDTKPASSYYLKTELTVQATVAGTFLNNDNYPKFGLVNKSDSALQTFHIDAAGREGTNFGTVHAIQSTAAGTNWQWDNNASTSIEGHWGNSYINRYRNQKLETIYYDGDLYFILNGILVKSVKDFAPASEGAIPGFMCFNTKATFTNNEYVTDPAQVKAELEQYLAKDLAIDGNLSDWTDEDVNRHARTVSDPSNGNAMKVRAFRGTDGLYIAYEVAHNVNLNASKWDAGWWLNTNIEFYVNGTTEANHYALTAFGDGGYMDAKMITTRNADRTYATVAEIFVPFTTLVKDGFDLNDTLKVGFAFKSTDGSTNSYLNGTDWWALEGTPTAVQLDVTAKGIGTEYTLSYDLGDGVTGTAPASVKAIEGDTVILAGADGFSKSGYTFAGWTDGTNAYAAGDAYTMPAYDVTLTPHWVDGSVSGATYTVTYAAGADDVEGTLPTDSNTYATGAAVTLAENTLTRAGYVFVGWTDGTTTYSAGSKIFMGTSAMTLTAVWAKVYALTYAYGADDVEGDLPALENYAVGDTVIVKSAQLTREGYSLYGWESSHSGKVYMASEAFTMPDEDVTLTAVWKPMLKVDGSLSDWKQLGTKTVEAHAIQAGDNRGATWYGALRDDGLYLAVDIYSNQIGSGEANWWDNMNFEIHLGPQAQQHYVWLTSFNAGFAGIGATHSLGKSSADIVAAFKYESGLLRGVAHHSTFEVFFPNAMISGLKETDGSLRIGLAIKTNGGNEAITGGSYNYMWGDAWYAPYGVLANEYHQFAYATKDGLFLKNEYLHEDWEFGAQSAVADDNSIVLDGDLSDWAGSHTIGIVGTDLQDYIGKSVTFYGKMTASGLYLAADAYHAVFTYGESDWWNNTNFELRIGEVWGSADNQWAKQFWVYATGVDTFGVSESYMQLGTKTEQLNNGKYHTVIELFIPAANLVQNDYMVQNGMMHVGVAWKTNGDKINNGAIGEDPWWIPQGTHINTNPACVTGSGIYTAKEYEALS